MIAEMRKPNLRLRDERRLRSWTQEEAAEALCRLCTDNPRARGEINAKMISRWETGENIPSMYYQKIMCQLFGKTAQELGFLTDYMEPGQTLSPIEERIVIGAMYGREMTSSHSSGGLYALASQNASRLMEEAGIDCFAVDDMMTLTQSNNFAGWLPEDIITTKLSTPLSVPADIEAIRQQKLPAIQQNFVNSSHYRLASYTPAFSDRRGLEVTLAPLGFHDYYTLIPFLDEPLLTDKQDVSISIREKYGVTSLTYSASEHGSSLIPAPVATHCVIVTKDQQIVLMQRSATVAFYPNHWSASFEETMDSPGLSPKRDIRPGDNDFFDCALRGLDEEFGITANEVESVKVLSLNVEYLILAVVPIAVIKVNLTASQVKSHWMLKAHDKNEATKFATISTDLTTVVDKLVEPGMLWHPTSRMRLIQFLFHTYGVDATADAIEACHSGR